MIIDDDTPKPSHTVAMLKLLPENDVDQRLRMTRFFMAVGTYAIGGALILYCYFLGILRLDLFGMGLWFAAVMSINTGFYVIFRSSINLRLKDKSLTAIQIATATLVIMVTIYFLNDGRGVALLFYLVPFTFGMFHLHLKQFLLLTVFAFTGYLLSAFLLLHNQPEAIVPQVEMIRAMVLAVVLTWFSFLGSYYNRLREMTTRQATKDELTQVHNRRQLYRLLEREKALADRTGFPFSICIIDLDYFKAVNDRFGHQTGDTVLHHIAQSIKSDLRNEDYIARYGGEEFALILSYPNRENALMCAERIRKLVASEHLTKKGRKIRVTISIGISEYTPKENIEKTLARADKALYRAKSRGRNRVEFEPSPAS